MSKRKSGKKKSNVSGEILLQFSLSDTSNPRASAEDVYRKFRSRVSSSDEEDFDLNQLALDDSIEADKDEEEETSDETDDPTKPEVVEKRKRRLQLARLKRRSIAARTYQFTGAGSGVEGIVFLEVCRIKDLPPELNGKSGSYTPKREFPFG
jgi:phosphatidylserine decarboxylase